MASDLIKVIDPEAVILGANAETGEEIIRLLAARLHALGYVKDTYADAVVKRERALPTGLPLDREENIAIPHTDAEHVLKPAVAVATLTSPVLFANMEEPDEMVPVGIVFLLAIDDKDKQIDTLQQIMETIQSQEALDGLKQAKTFEDLRIILAETGRQAMSRQKTILFACGTGVATSTAVNVAVTDEMKKRGLTFNARQAKATEVLSLVDNVDFIVSTTPVSASVTKPVIKGLAFLTGIGKDKVLDEIEAELRK